MRCAAALSTLSDSEAALSDVLDRVRQGLGADSLPADLAVAFVSPHHASAVRRLADRVRDTGLARQLLAATAEAVVGEGREIEDGPALGLWAIKLPEGVRLTPVRLTARGPDDIQGWPPPAGANIEPSAQALILIADPFSFPTDAFLARLNAEARGLRVVGGMASGGRRPGSNRLALGDRVFDTGAVGLLIDGPVRLQTVVSQGCRPVGRPMIVTKAEQNLIHELGRRPAMDVLRETFEALDEAEQELFRQGLHLGRVINEYQESFGRGDFLVRNVQGVTTDGAIGINDRVRVGQTVQFHVRDAASADEDLHALLARPAGTVAPAGVLLFSCNGRGTRLFDAPDHDAAALADAFGPIPVLGFFAMGEVGPVGGQNFLHGFTASIALFEEP